jgi:ribose transport system substrate-binding protein
MNIRQHDEKYVGIYAMAGYDYFTDHKIGFARAGEVLNVETEYMGPADNDIEEMKECFKYAIAEEVSGIIVFGANDSLAEMIDKAAEAGIPTVTVDGDVKDSRRIAFVGTGNLTVGMIGGEVVVQLIGESGNVGILTEPDVDLHRDRTKGYEQFFAQYDGINIVGIGDTKANPDDSYEAALKMINDNPELDAIVCTDYFGGIGAAIAVEEQGKQGDIKIVSMDRSRFVLQKIEEGVISATLVQQTALMPYYAMRILYDYNHNTLPIVADKESAGITGVPVNVDTGVFVIDIYNYKEFLRS